MDAYVWGEFQLNDRPLDLRLGQQVLSWGKHLHPGRPQCDQPDRRQRPNHARGRDQGSADSGQPVQSVAWHQRESRPAPFTNWNGAPRYSQVAAPSSPSRMPVSQAAAHCMPFQVERKRNRRTCSWSIRCPAGANMVIPRISDDTPADAGSAPGLLRRRAEQHRACLYVMNYHSRLPYTNAITADYSKRPAAASSYPELPTTRSMVAATPPLAQAPLYQMAFPKTSGCTASVSTPQDPGYSMSGELSHRPNQPIAINGQDFLRQRLSTPSHPSSTNCLAWTFKPRKRPYSGQSRRPLWDTGAGLSAQTG